ncbi:MAG: class I SAM-dependent rRNA methyltransferase [Bryobacteraceae bacterium]|nr:class I SAM-dependent rRNA methyltransferase [Bryobacteraceae bacterium]
MSRSNESPTVRVNRRAEARLADGHVWVYASDIEDRGGAQPGDTVRVTGARGRFLAVAHYSSTSQIALRLLATRDRAIDAAFFRGRIAAAWGFRQRLPGGAGVCRLVHAEGDLLPGLIVDKYGSHLSVQFLTQGMDRAKAWIVEALNEIVSPAGILARNDAAARRLESLPQEQEILAGEVPETVEFEMNGLRWRANLRRGQKTGVFLDQRENYLAAARWARGRALDCFTSTGGFALHLARVCESVEGVDSSATALETAAANRDLNGIGNVAFREADAFDYLSGLSHARRAFETIVLDPPAFAKTKSQAQNALRAYKEMNLKALKLLAPAGVLITCSCSHHVSEADLLGVVAQAALHSGRTLRVLERRAQAADHPILLTVPETLYLKCLIFEAL